MDAGIFKIYLPWTTGILGKNLYSLGACFVAFQKKETEREYVYLGDSEFKMNISLKVRKKRELEFYSLVTAGENWYLKEHSCEVILDGTDTVELWLQHPYGGEAKNREFRACGSA